MTIDDFVEHCNQRHPIDVEINGAQLRIGRWLSAHADDQYVETILISLYEIDGLQIGINGFRIGRKNLQAALIERALPC